MRGWIDLNIARKKYVSLMEALQILDKKAKKVGEEEMANLLLEGSAKKVGETILSNSKSQNNTMKGKEKRKVRVRWRSTKGVRLCVNIRKRSV